VENSDDEEQSLSPKKTGKYSSMMSDEEDDTVPSEEMVVISGHAADLNSSFPVPDKVTIVFSANEGEIDYIPDDFTSVKMQIGVARSAAIAETPGQFYLSGSDCPNYEVYFDEKDAITHDIFVIQSEDELQFDRYYEPLSSEDSGVIERFDGKPKNTTLFDIVTGYANTIPAGTTLIIYALFCRGGGDAPGQEENFAFGIADPGEGGEDLYWTGGGYGGLDE
jgi:hypothetical protein